MTPDQFKAWFEGFCEAVSEAPTPEQWAKIKTKVTELREKPLVTLRDEFQKRYDGAFDQPLTARGVIGGSFGRDPAEMVEKLNAQASHDAEAARRFGGTRVLDPVSGADLGPAD